MMIENKLLVIKAFDDQPLIRFGKYKFLINPLTEQIPATSAELLQAATDWIVAEGDFSQATKIAGEEDKGAILVAATSLATTLPFGEYTSGQLFLNGIEKDDKVIIVDDMISTGGTMLALIEAVQLAKGRIVDIVCVAEKLEYKGVQRVANDTGYQVKTLLKISISGERSKVIQTR
jgi:adenine/guanine phosphoribosyltransferase-like PRPP-binding protein